MIRIKIQAEQKTGHSSFVKGQTALEKILVLIDHIKKKIPESLKSDWMTTFVIPYLKSGEIDNFNTMPKRAEAGLEIRPIPEDDIQPLLNRMEKEADELGINYSYVNCEQGIKTSVEDSRVKTLLEIIGNVYGGSSADHLGTGKLPGTQARFAPEGCAAIVFGQSGIGPHSDNEAHYIPSIMPYYKILEQLSTTEI